LRIPSWSDDESGVDRRVISEEWRVYRSRAATRMKEGDIVSGAVRSLTTMERYRSGGIDGLLHISDISWSRVKAAEDVLAVGQELRVKVLKVDAEGRRVRLG